MKLIFVNRYFFPDHSATSQILSDLAFHLASQPGREVWVVTCRQRYDVPAEDLPARETIRGVHVCRVWTTRFGRGGLLGRALDYLTFYLTAGWELLRLARRGDVLIAKTDPPLIAVVAGVVARLRRASLVNWVQDVFPEVAVALGLKLPFAGVVRRVRNASLRSAQAIVVVGARMAAWARAQGVPEDRIVMISNWADGNAIRPLAVADNPLRREWGLDGKFVVGYSGNLGRAHEFSTVIDAADRLRSEADVVFLFIGGGHGLAAVEEQVKGRRLPNVRCLPYQPRESLGLSLGVPDLHWISLRLELEGLVVPSKAYGVLAAGRPVLMVGDPDGEVGRLIRACGCGETIEIGNDAGLVEAILRLRRNPQLCERLGSRAREAYEANFTPGHAFSAWDRLLSKVGVQR